ncbi:MAG: DUF2163 domain-containing protein [Devosia sp.]
MRTLDLGFKTHIESAMTTLATCWKITRKDAVTLGFTDHDETLSFGGTDYRPAHGLDGGEASAKLGPQVDTAEVLGVLHSEVITEDDILLGRYDDASVETWRVNWRDVSQRLLQRRATIGEIVREDGVFRAELRSGQAALNQVKGRIYSPLCDAGVGDARCGVDLDTPAFKTDAAVTAIRDRYRIAVSGIEGFPRDWFALGRARWSSGRRGGIADAVVGQTRLGGEDILSFAQPVGDWVIAGDTLTLTAGCDRRFATCRDRFANTVNFRGFPHIPGNDFVLRHPKPGSRLEGQALIK